MQKEIICTECANRCHLLVEQQGEEIIVSGNRCPRGLKSGREEFLGERVTVHGFVRCGEEKIAVQTSNPAAKRGERRKKRTVVWATEERRRQVFCMVLQK